MSHYKIVISDYYYPNIDQERRILAQLGPDVEIVDCTQIIPGGAKTCEQLLPFVGDADALMTQFAGVDAQVIAAMRQCKVIAHYAVGVDLIDIEAATRKNIKVANVPDYCLDEVSNSAIALMLDALRKITVARDLLLKGEFNMDAIQPIKRVSDTTLCLIGFGNIARNVYAKAKAFFARVVVYDPYFNGQADYPEITFLTLEEALSQADVVSIHVPLTKSTKGLLGRAQFAQMKDGAVLVNTARGALIDEDAMLEALDSGKLGYAGLDVLADDEYEHTAFLRHPHVCLTPHIAWNSDGSREELQRKTAENVVSALLTGQPVYCVN
ncbi:C-terminal binding protein [Pelolinea submarina]|uniref:D-3-phosphoglycerate dehydrogenase n=1 Tax=Pelolinea submarina TaxID=913107 RepID=A0A347ZR35_9CHLR|nr:C-terminal binding protein [Pelolinea submarina]REG11680.1 D-3-phosphoglycerate dehydrogenase [Pelolinea submarina]BBB47766.1 D-3-phosphoglycerate dehydrogenase [Pelolinea submarina]